MHKKIHRRFTPEIQQQHIKKHNNLCTFYPVPFQVGPDDGSHHTVLHADPAELRFGAAMEPRGETPRRHMPEDLVEKLPVHSQLLRF